MSAPEEKSLRNLSGKWKMNRKSSNDVDGVLQIQGFNAVMRKAIALAPVYLDIAQSKQGEHAKYKIDQTTTAKIPGVNEEWITDWEFRESKDPVMGDVKAKARWTKPDSVEDSDFLAGGWEENGEQQIEALVESLEHGWTAHQTWGFEDQQGKRSFVRRVVVKKDDQVEKVRLVYDYESG